MKECLTKPKVINPLSVSTKDKKRLILDLRHINNYLFKDKTKFNDWNDLQYYLEDNKGHLFKFDLKSRYHHFDIKAIRYSLDLTKNLLRKKHIKWHIDNYVSSISKIKKLQKGTSKASNINF